ncbi:MAG: hypothetical protein WAW17_09885 [Rhodococcus sp. (in: high G+C Gram-positive bacteria)]|uniref:hypothetical protein n=1 Tax=Rhodococcus sp. TaxID=1831 RepID=UPI003BB0BBA2
MHTEPVNSAPTTPRSIRALHRQFRSLEGGDIRSTAGMHEAVFVGPRFLRLVAPRAIALGGMPGWYGKRFDAAGEGVNLLRESDGSLRETLPMRVRLDASWLDGRPALVVSYGSGAPVPWRWVRDEFRVLDDRTLLALTFAISPRSRVLASPFTLIRRD